MSAIQVIAGGAGFIGCNLVRELVRTGDQLVVLDDFSRGKLEYLQGIDAPLQVIVKRCDLANREDVGQAFTEISQLGNICEVWHLAANSDIPAGVTDADVDLSRTFMTTFEILGAMRRHGATTLHFASSSAIYGNHGSTPLHEALAPLLPISNYGAMKLASEAIISASTESWLKRANVFRFPNVVGIPATHGVIYDFARKLLKDKSRLEVLGNGTQQKAYLHVSDLISAMLAVRSRDAASHGKVEIINVGAVDEGVSVQWIAQETVRRMSPGATTEFGQSDRGWIGDVPRFIYSTARLQSYGWAPTMDSKAAVSRAIDEIARQHGL